MGSPRMVLVEVKGERQRGERRGFGARSIVEAGRKRAGKTLEEGTEQNRREGGVLQCLRVVVMAEGRGW